MDLEGQKIIISKTLQRFTNEALKDLPGDEIIRIFPEKTPNSKSKLVLKIPKTVQSERYIYLTSQLVDELEKRKKVVDRQKQYLEDEYPDYNLVFCLENGDPTETHLIERWFVKWQKKTPLELPHILFRQLRHSSTTFKLRESGGDIKSVMGDTGHSSPDMALRVYGQLVDKDRRELTDKMEERFHKKDLETNKASHISPEGNLSSEINMASLEKFLSSLQNEDPQMHKQVLAAILSKK